MRTRLKTEILYTESRYKGKENNESNQTEAVQKKKAELEKTKINWRLGDPSRRQR